MPGAFSMRTLACSGAAVLSQSSAEPASDSSTSVSLLPRSLDNMAHNRSPMRPVSGSMKSPVLENLVKRPYEGSGALPVEGVAEPGPEVTQGPDRGRHPAHRAEPVDHRHSLRGTRSLHGEDVEGDQTRHAVFRCAEGLKRIFDTAQFGLSGQPPAGPPTASRQEQP